MASSHIPPQLADLFEMRNTVQQCRSIDEVLHRCISVARNHVDAQSASVFLYSKDGVLERKAFQATSKEGNALDDKWFPEDRYAIGDSFTGRVLETGPSSQFGRPQWTSQLDKEDLNQQSRAMYTEALGFLECAVAVPLNGRHRTFGVLEVINKIGNGRRPVRGGVFSSSELFWLSILGITTANAITLLRAQEELALLRHISQLVTQPVTEGPDPNSTFEAVAADLTSPFTSYKACIIRAGSSPETLEVVAMKGDKIDWDKRKGGPRSDIDLVGKVFCSRQYRLVPDIDSELQTFVNSEWIISNGLRSCVCLPLTGKEQVHGTLSLFTGYKYSFDDTELAFIESIASLLGSVLDTLRTDEQTYLQAASDQSQILSGARLSGHDRLITELKHQQKRFLLSLQAGLQAIADDVGGRAGKVIDQQLRQIAAQVNNILDEFSSTAHSAVQLNHIVSGVLKSFSAELRRRHIKTTINLDSDIPRIEASEVELRDVIVNLVSNAIKAIMAARRTGGYIVVTTRLAVADRQQVIELTVEDDGIGIKNEHLDEIFKYGFTTYEGGTGVGLYVTRSIVISYEGSIAVESNVGKGTLVAIRLPLRLLAME